MTSAQTKWSIYACRPVKKTKQLIVFVFFLLENLFSQGGSLLPSIYADARYIDGIIVSQADIGIDTAQVDLGQAG